MQLKQLCSSSGGFPQQGCYSSPLLCSREVLQLHSALPGCNNLAPTRESFLTQTVTLCSVLARKNRGEWQPQTEQVLGLYRAS